MRINTLVSKYSMNDVEHLIELASKYTDEINFFTIVFTGRGTNLEKDDSVTEQEHLIMSKKIEELKKKYPKLNILHFSQVSRETSIREDLNSKYGLKICSPSGATTINIMSDGGIWCGGYTPYIDSSLKLGNIKDDQLFNVWQNNNVLEKIRDESGKLIIFCCKCVEYIKGKCQGSKYETELQRLVHPETKNPWCIHGDGPSLLNIIKNDRSI